MVSVFFCRLLSRCISFLNASWGHVKLIRWWVVSALHSEWVRGIRAKYCIYRTGSSISAFFFLFLLITWNVHLENLHFFSIKERMSWCQRVLTLRSERALFNTSHCNWLAQSTCAGHSSLLKFIFFKIEKLNYFLADLLWLTKGSREMLIVYLLL